MTFDDVRASEASQIAVLINSAYRTPEVAPRWNNENGLLEGIRIDEGAVQAELDSGRFITVRMEPASSATACIHITRKDDGAWYLSLLAVDPAHQNQGLGAALIEEVAKQALAAHAPCLRITVIQQRAALIEWYERRGFRRTGLTIPFPYDDPSVGRPTRDDFVLIVLERTLGNDLAQSDGS